MMGSIIYLFINMQSNSYSYSIKVWLTSVCIGPMTLIVINSGNNAHQANFVSYLVDVFMYYILCIIIGGLFSLLTWLIFFCIIRGLIATFPSSRQLKHLIATVGLLLTAGTFAIFGWRIFNIHNELFYLMLTYAICIAGGSYFYKLEIIGLEPWCVDVE